MTRSITAATQLYDIKTVVDSPKSLDQYFNSLAKMALDAPKLAGAEVSEVRDAYKRFIAVKINTIYEHWDDHNHLYKCTFESTTHRGGVKTTVVKEDPSNPIKLPERLLKDTSFANYLKTLRNYGKVELKEMHLHPNDYLKLNGMRVNLIIKADVCITTHRFKDESI